MSFNVGSAKSNGIANIHLKSNSPVVLDFHDLNTKMGFVTHSKVPDIKVMPATIAESFQRAKDALFPDEPNLTINRKQLVINCVQALRTDSEEEWRRNLLAIRDSLADDVMLQEWFDSNFLNRAHALESCNPQLKWERGFDGGNLHLDAMGFGVTDVFGVAELCEKLVGYRERAFEWPKRGKWLRRRLRSAARILIKGQ